MRYSLAAAVVVGGVALAPAVSAAPQVEHFIGSSTIRNPAGQTMRIATRLIKRTLDPQAGTIVEQSVTIDEKPRPAPANELVVTLHVKPDGSFTVTEKNQSFTGTGALVGKPWAWHHWEAMTKLRDGMSVESKTDLREGKYQATKQLYSKKGDLMATVKETLTSVLQDEFEERYRKASGRK